MKLRRLSTRSPGFDAELATLTRYDAGQDAEVQAAVRAIIADVRARGDAAVLEYAARFDKVSASSKFPGKSCNSSPTWSRRHSSKR